MSDSEFLKLEKAEQEVLAQIAKQKETCERTRTEYLALRADFLQTYNAVFKPLQTSLLALAGDEWAAHRRKLDSVVANVSAAITDSDTSEDVGRLQDNLKARVKEAIAESDSTVNQFEEMRASLHRLEALVHGEGPRDFLEELQSKKQTLEKEEDRLKGLQDRYDRYFGQRRTS